MTIGLNRIIDMLHNLNKIKLAQRFNDMIYKFISRKKRKKNIRRACLTINELFGSHSLRNSEEFPRKINAYFWLSATVS